MFRWPGRRPSALVRGVLAALSPVDHWVVTAAARGEREAIREVRGAASGRLVFDPFAGAGTIPVEASRLGYRAVGYDVNPNAILVARAASRLCSGSCGERASCIWRALASAWGKARELWCMGEECVVHVLLARCPPCRAPVWVSSKRGAGGPRAYLLLDSDGRLRWVRDPPEGLSAREPSIELPPSLPREHEDYVAYAIEVYSPGGGRRWISLLDPGSVDWRVFLQESAAAASTIASLQPDVSVPPGEETRRLYKAGVRGASQLFAWRQAASLAYFAEEAARCPIEAAALIATQAPTLSLLAVYYQRLAKVNPGMVVKSFWLPRNPVVLNPFSHNGLPAPPGPYSKPLGRGSLVSGARAYSRACARGPGCSHAPTFMVADSTSTPPPGRVDMVVTDPPYPGMHTYRDTTLFYSYARALAGLGGVEDWEEIDTRDPGVYVRLLSKALELAARSTVDGGLLVLLVSAPHPEGIVALARVLSSLDERGVGLQRIYPLVSEMHGRLGRSPNKAGFLIVTVKGAESDPTAAEPLGWTRSVLEEAGLRGGDLEYSVKAAAALRRAIEELVLRA